jgi:hypothetical protein
MMKTCKKWPVNCWVKGFDSPVKNFWVAGKVRNMENFKA